VIPKEGTKTIDLECEITGVKQALDISKQVIDIAVKSTEKVEVEDMEKREIKKRKLLEVTEEEIEDTQEDISKQVDSFLKELKQRKSKRPLVIVSPGLPLKNEHILYLEDRDSSYLNKYLAKSLIIKYSTLIDAQELSGPRFITSTNVKNNQFNLLIIQTKSNKNTSLT